MGGSMEENEKSLANKKRQSLVRPCLCSWINKYLLDSIPVDTDFFRRQRYDKNWFSGPMQY